MKKKFILLSLFVCILMTGCTPVQKMSLGDIINKETNRTVEVYNKYRKGYKYNLPIGLDVYDNSDYNEVLMDSNYVYYLYVDAVSYYNKVIEKYEVSDKAYISMPINYYDKYGYLEITEKENGKYFIEIMYNYAKIEVVIKKRDINVVVANSLSVLASIHFNNDILKSLLGDEISQFSEFDFNIFETTTTTVDSEYLQAMDDYVYEGNDIHDTDLIK